MTLNSGYFAATLLVLDKFDFSPVKNSRIFRDNLSFLYRVKKCKNILSQMFYPCDEFMLLTPC